MKDSNPPSTWKVVPFADYGVREPFVARLVLGLDEILGATQFTNREEIRDAIGDLALHSVGAAFLSLQDLRKIGPDPRVGQLHKTKAADDMYKCLWAAYKDRLSIAARAMGYDIGFLFQKSKTFEAGCVGFAKKYPNGPAIVACMTENRASWQPRLADFRNYFAEHKKLTSAQVAEFHTLDFAEKMFETVWVACEEILVLLLAGQLPAQFGFVEIRESERDPNKPLRFRPVLVGVTLPKAT